MLRPLQVTPPSGTPVTLTEMKTHLRIDGSDEDTLVQSYIDAATSYLDGATGILGRCLLTQTWAVKLPSFPSADFKFPFPDVDGSAVVVKYYDSDDVEQNVAAAEYSVHEGAASAHLTFRSTYTIPSIADRDDAVSITFDAGYGAASDVPAAIRNAIMIMVARAYQDREGVEASGGGMSRDPVYMLIAPFRRIAI